MPGRDGTGPLGCGAMTGRGLGGCLGVQPGRGVYGRLWRRCGGGPGLGRFLAVGPTQSQREILSDEKKRLEQRLSIVTKTLESL
ncbi:MAG: DUF5320 domain-containing protein [Bacillota bacterium]